MFTDNSAGSNTCYSYTPVTVDSNLISLFSELPHLSSICLGGSGLKFHLVSLITLCRLYIAIGESVTFYNRSRLRRLIVDMASCGIGAPPPPPRNVSAASGSMDDYHYCLDRLTGAGSDEVARRRAAEQCIAQLIGQPNWRFLPSEHFVAYINCFFR
ncbi:unnamed protein product [Protopolystoma xenopodis]|uniref:Uncharacterized protein n=1 Tax=Protopolystoma xenopodis TaxID=117903 RepID=A0A448WZP6_9PLAT|nr:unnamed protein product [Protopolystoma xenopodis]